MVELSSPEHQKNRTGWAILVAFVAYILLYAIYALGLAGVTYLGARFDKSGAWVGITFLSFFVLTPISTFCAVKVAFRYFPRASVESVFYAFSTGAIVIALASSGPKEPILVCVVQAALAVAGAWLATKV